jgi:hypothetical protein
MDEPSPFTPKFARRFIFWIALVGSALFLFEAGNDRFWPLLFALAICWAIGLGVYYVFNHASTLFNYFHDLHLLHRAREKGVDVAALPVDGELSPEEQVAFDTMINHYNK